MFFIKICHFQANREERLTRLYVYHDRLSFPIVYQSYRFVRVYYSIVRLCLPIVHESYRLSCI